MDWSRSSLLLVAHGSSRTPESAAGLARLAERIRQRALFERVDIAFWRQDPFLAEEHLSAAFTYVLPFFAGLGKHTEQLIPARLRLTGPLTRRDGRQIVYCPPVGCHPALPELIARRALSLCGENDLDPAATALLVIGHGSRDGGASRTPESIASALRAYPFAEIGALFLEQPPFARDWAQLVRSRAVIAQPLLLSAGMHQSEDLPRLFDPAAHPQRRIWLQQGIGSDEEIVAIMLDQIGAAAPEFAR